MMSESLKERINPNVFISSEERIKTFSLSVDANHENFSCHIVGMTREKGKIKISFLSSRSLTSILMRKEFLINLSINDGESEIFSIGQVDQINSDIEIVLGSSDSQVSIIIDSA
jgi:c-di-GMP-binding flagellar brake protein YcgR